MLFSTCPARTTPVRNVSSLGDEPPARERYSGNSRPGSAAEPEPGAAPQGQLSISF
jgi:hypothetical protein